MSHNGSIDGFNSLVSLFPQENLGIVILTNCNSMASAILINSLAKEISDSLLGLKYKKPIRPFLLLKFLLFFELKLDWVSRISELNIIQIMFK